MEFPSVTVILGVFAVLIVLNYVFLDDSQVKGGKSAVVTVDMINRVREVAPELSTPTIIRDLQRTGDIQITVERYLSGRLSEASPNISGTTTGMSQRQSQGLTEQVNRDSPKTGEMELANKNEETKPDVGTTDGPFNGKTYEQIRMEMIMQGRHNIEQRKNTKINWLDV